MKISEVAAPLNASTKTLRLRELRAAAAAFTHVIGASHPRDPRSWIGVYPSAAGLALQEVRQILAIHDRGEAPCAHVRQPLSTRIDEVRAQIAEPTRPKPLLQTLLDHASIWPAH